MNVKEIFTGGREVKEARNIVRELSKRTNISRGAQRRLEDAERITRRHFLRITGVALGVAVGTGLGVWKLQDFLEGQETDDDVRNSYLAAFRRLAAGDTQGEKLINFYQKAARKAHYKGEIIIADEPGIKGENFWVAVVNSDHRIVSYKVHGIASYDRNQDILSIKRIKLTEDWKGALFAHEVKHAYDDLIGNEEDTQQAFDEGEVNAYEFELHLLNRKTGGHLKERMQSQSRNVLEERLRGRLSSDDFSAFDTLFPKSLNEGEENLRTVAYTIGLNFAVIESRYDATDEIKQQKIRYIRSVLEGRIPILPVP